jgi:hypothetical protein
LAKTPKQSFLFLFAPLHFNSAQCTVELGKS